MRTYVTLTGEDSEAFESIREDLAGPGSEPSNAEVVRRLMRLYYDEELVA